MESFRKEYFKSQYVPAITTEYISIYNQEIQYITQPGSYKITDEIEYIAWQTQDNILHKLNAPALEFANGRKEYWFEGRKHREDGPAIIGINGHNKEYWINGIKQYPLMLLKTHLKNKLNDLGDKNIDLLPYLFKLYKSNASHNELKEAIAIFRDNLYNYLQDSEVDYYYRYLNMYFGR